MNWLLLRGLYRHGLHWHEFPRELERLVPGSKVHLLDLPGTGTEWQRESPASIPGIREDLRSRWLELRTREPSKDWGLFAVSLGGMVAMDWCETHPDDFRRLVLVNTSSSDAGQTWERLRPGAWASLFRIGRADEPLACETALLRITTRMLGKERLVSLAMTQAGFLKDSSISKATALRQLWAASRFKAPARLQVSSLMLISCGDQLVSPECSRRIATRLGSEVREHPSAGHDLPLDDPDWVGRAVAAWVS